MFISLLSLHGEDDLLRGASLEDDLGISSVSGSFLEEDGELVLLGGSSL